MERKFIDMWYGDDPCDCTGMTCSFSDVDCVYRGNFLKNGRFVGDYTARDWGAVENLYRLINRKEAHL